MDPALASLPPRVQLAALLRWPPVNAWASRGSLTDRRILWQRWRLWAWKNFKKTEELAARGLGS